MAHSRSHSTFCVLKTHGQAKPLHSDRQSSVLVSEAQIRYRSSSSSIRAEIASLFPLFPHREGILVLSELDVTLASQMSLKHLVCALCCAHRAVGSWQRCVRTSLVCLPLCFPIAWPQSVSCWLRVLTWEGFTVTAGLHPSLHPPCPNDCTLRSQSQS